MLSVFTILFIFKKSKKHRGFKNKYKLLLAYYVDDTIYNMQFTVMFMMKI